MDLDKLDCVDLVVSHSALHWIPSSVFGSACFVFLAIHFIVLSFYSRTEAREFSDVNPTQSKVKFIILFK